MYQKLRLLSCHKNDIKTLNNFRGYRNNICEKIWRIARSTRKKDNKRQKEEIPTNNIKIETDNYKINVIVHDLSVFVSLVFFHDMCKCNFNFQLVL